MSKSGLQSSLSRQLQSLSESVPTTRVAQQPSFLYERTAAADVADETVRHLGLNGFEWLRSQDARFEALEQALAHKGTASLSGGGLSDDRTALTRRENMQLDEHIHALLALLSPYFLHHACHKVLEFLVRFYRINEYNVVGVIQCILPYHETEYFSRMVQILHLRDTSWSFLSRFSASKNGVDRATLVSYCLADKSVLNTVLNVATQSTSLSFMPSPSISFTVATLASLLEQSGFIKEDIVILILGHFEQWCSSSKDEKLQIASYATATMLSVKVPMSKQLTSAILSSVLNKKATLRPREALLCAMQVVKYQKLSSLSDSLVDQIFAITSVADVLSDITSTYVADEFLQVLAINTINSPNAKESNIHVLKELLHRLPFKSSSKLIANAAAVKVIDKNTPASIVSGCKDILEVIQNLYPAEFDSLVNEALQKKSLEGSDDANSLADFLSRLVLDTGFSTFVDSRTIFSALEHKFSNIRRQASESLLSLPTNAPFQSFGDKIVARLGDDDPMVVANVLAFPGLVHCAPADAIFNAIASILKSADKFRIHPFALNALSTWFVSTYPDYEEQIAKLAFKFILGNADCYRRTLQAVFFFLNNRNTLLLTGFKDHFPNTVAFGLDQNPIQKYSIARVDENVQGKAIELNEAVLKAVLKCLPMDKIALESIPEHLQSAGSNQLFSPLIPIYATYYSQNHSTLKGKIHCWNVLKQVWPLVEKDASQDLQSVKQTESGIGIFAPVVMNSLNPLADKNNFVNLYVHLIGLFLSSVKPVFPLNSSPELLGLVEDMFVFFSRSTVFSETMRSLLSTYAGQDILHFLLNISTKESLPSVAVLRSYQIIHILISSLWQSVNEPTSLDVTLMTNLFPYFFDGIVHPIQAIRKEAIKLLELLCSFRPASPSDQVSPSLIFLQRDVGAISLSKLRAIPSDAWALWSSFLLSHRDRFVKDEEYGYHITKDYSISTGTGNKSQVEVWLFSFFAATDSSRVKHTILKTTRHWSSPSKIQSCLDLLAQNYHSLGKGTKILTPFEEKLACEAVMALSLRSSGSIEHFFTPVSILKQQSTLFDFCLETLLQAPVPALQEECLNCFTNTFYTKLDILKQKKILMFLSKSPASSRGSRLGVKVQELFKEFSLTATVIEETLSTMIQSVPKPSNAQKKMKGKSTEFDAVQQLESVSPLLELLHLNANFEYSEALFLNIFSIVELAAGIRSDLSDESNIEYAKQLAITLLATLVTKAAESKTKQKHPNINYEALVDLFSSSSEVVRFQIIILMTNLGYAFIGEFGPNFGSFILMLEVIIPQLYQEKVIEAVLQSLSKLLPVMVSTNNHALVVHLARLFIDHAESMKHSCRIRLFGVILKHMATQGTHDILATCIARSLINRDHKMGEFSFLSFAHELLLSVPPDVQVQSIIQLVSLCNRVPGALSAKGAFKALHLVPYFSPSPVDRQNTVQFVHESIKFIPEHILDDRFLNAFVLVGEKKGAKTLQAHILTALERLIELHVNIFENSSLNDGLPDVGSLKQGLADIIYQGIDALCELQDTKSFVISITRLLGNNDDTTQRRSLSLFQSQIEKKIEKMKASDTSLFTSMAQNLVELIDGKESQSRSPITKQTALLSMEILVQNFAAKHADKYMDFTPSIARVLKDDDLTISASACLTLSALCGKISKHTIPYLRDIVPPCLEKIGRIVAEKHDGSNLTSLQSTFILSSCILIESLVKNLSQFLSPYVESILDIFLSPVFIDPSAELSDKVTGVRTLFASNTNPRNLIAPLHKKFASLLERSPKTLHVFFSMMKSVFERMDPTSMVTEHLKSFKFFLIALDSYLPMVAKLDEEVETSIFDAFMEMVLKLNETSFKPLFMKLMEWSGFQQSKPTAISKKQMVFHKLVYHFVDRLKSIFVPYFGFLLDQYIVLLTESTSVAKQKKQKIAESEGEPLSELLRLILSSLEKCFLHDSAQFIDQEKFEKIYRPLVDQLGRVHVFGDQFLPFVHDVAKPCLTQLAVTLSSETLWKSMNHYVLMKTRSDHPETRRGALIVVQELYNRLGDEYLGLLPESIPFIAELLEDEDQDVENQTRSLVQTIEKYLGKSLQSYLK